MKVAYVFATSGHTASYKLASNPPDHVISL
jgi:hypothetical protein